MLRFRAEYNRIYLSELVIRTALTLKFFPPVRLDALWSIQPLPAFAKPALTRFCVCIRIRVLLIWKWVANPTAHLHCNKLHADRPLDCNRTGGIFVISGRGQVEMFADAIEASANDRPVRIPVAAKEIRGEAELRAFMKMRKKANADKG